MTKRIVLLFLVVALSLAYAETYKVSLWQPTTLGGKELKAGDYKVDVTDSKVIFRRGGVTVESEARVQKADVKFSTSLVRFDRQDGKYRLREIRLGGTNLIVVVN